VKFYQSSSWIEAAPDLIWSILTDGSGFLGWDSGVVGLFEGERTYTLVPEGSKTTFTMREEYTGLFRPMIWKSIPDLQPSFDQFAQGLKAEGNAG
jgi:hypothetical protein